MTKLAKYPSYKNSGIEWLGDIPEHWEMIKVKNLSKLQKIKSFDKNPVILSLARDKIKVRDISTGEGQIAATYDGYNRVKTGDFLLNPMDLYSGANCNVSYLDGVISPSYINLKFNRNIDVKYADFYFKLMYENMFLFSLGKGVSSENRWTLNNETLMNIKIPVPPLQEQEKIANYLDKKVSQIDTLIEQKQKLIELLKEQKQIVINDVVTKGLDKNVELKESGIEWIGKIPKHWEIKKLKNICIVNSKTLDENSNNNLEIKYVDIGSVSFETGINKVENFLFSNAPSRARRIVKKNDTIISTVRTYLKAIDFIDELKAEYIFSTGFAVLEPEKNLEPIFLTFFVKSNFFTNQVDINSKGMSYPAINSTDLSNLIVLLPPKEEQIQIVEYIEKQISKIDSAIELEEKYIEKLKEYKTTLIDSVVTGKVRVC
ncbi:MAG: restriction endonuclease subunit S [Campylobacter sp.]|nr:restriction endonuclease subunit S [Campylobacter sp.]